MTFVEISETFLAKLIEWGIIPEEGTYLCPYCNAPMKLFTIQED